MLMGSHLIYDAISGHLIGSSGPTSNLQSEQVIWMLSNKSQDRGWSQMLIVWTRSQSQHLRQGNSWSGTRLIHTFLHIAGSMRTHSIDFVIHLCSWAQAGHRRVSSELIAFAHTSIPVNMEMGTKHRAEVCEWQSDCVSSCDRVLKGLCVWEWGGLPERECVFVMEYEWVCVRCLTLRSLELWCLQASLVHLSLNLCRLPSDIRRYWHLIIPTPELEYQLTPTSYQARSLCLPSGSIMCRVVQIPTIWTPWWLPEFVRVHNVSWAGFPSLPHPHLRHWFSTGR